MKSKLNPLDAFKNTAPEDSRIKRIQGALKRCEGRRDVLIEILHMVQEYYGYVPLWVMNYLAKEMKVPASRIYGVVTFYHFFSLKPKGDHTCVVCTGTACHVKGSKDVIDKVAHEFSIQPGETTPDGKLGLQTARCLGCCSLGPVVVLDNEIVAKADKDKIVPLIKKTLESKS